MKSYYGDTRTSWDGFIHPKFQPIVRDALSGESFGLPKYFRDESEARRAADREAARMNAASVAA